MKEWLFIVLLLFGKLLFSQSDTINKYDANGKKHGYWILYDKDIKIEEGRFEYGVKTGIWKGYYSNGKLKFEITYVNGKPNGYAKFYYENGNLNEEGIWRENKWVGDYKYYYQNGNLAYEWKYSETGKRTGIQKYYHENGKLMIEGEWKEGKESGLIREFDVNGNLIAEKQFNDGQLDVSSVKIYTPENKSTVSQKEEKKELPVIQESKPANTEIGYFDGNGFHRVYTKDGKLDREGEWKNGRLIDGKKYFYDENGKLIKTTIYKNGNVVNIIYNN